MPRAIVYWVIVLIWVILWLAPVAGYSAPHMGEVSNVVLLILFILLGWQVYGQPIHG